MASPQQQTSSRNPRSSEAQDLRTQATPSEGKTLPEVPATAGKSALVNAPTGGALREGSSSGSRGFLTAFDRMQQSMAECAREMDQAFGSFGGLAKVCENLQRNIPHGVCMSVDVACKPDQCLVRCECPGMRPEDLKVTVANGQLCLSCEKREDSFCEGDQYMVRECSYGATSRTVQIPTDCVPDRMRTNYNNGVFHITIPRSGTAPCAPGQEGASHASHLSQGVQTQQAQTQRAQTQQGQTQHAASAGACPPGVQCPPGMQQQQQQGACPPGVQCPPGQAPKHAK